jgi:hypothetical protein
MISFGNNVILSQTDVFVACYDSAGYAQWARGAETQDIYPMYGTSVASSPTGYVYTVGFTFEDQDLLFGNTLLSGHNAYITKYSPAGTLQWVKGIAANSADIAYGLAVDEDNNVYVSGHFSSLAIFGNDTVGSAGGDDIMVVKLDSNGNMIWWKTAGGTGGDASYSLATDNNGFVYLTGYIGSAPANFGPYSASTTGGRDMYLAKLSQTTGLPVTAGQNEELRAYPNPCNEELWLSGAATQSHYRITDITGRQIADGKVQNGRIDVQQLPPGLYILTLPEGRMKFVKR